MLSFCTLQKQYQGEFDYIVQQNTSLLYELTLKLIIMTINLIPITIIKTASSTFSNRPASSKERWPCIPEDTSCGLFRIFIATFAHKVTRSA